MYFPARTSLSHISLGALCYKGDSVSNISPGCCSYFETTPLGCDFLYRKGGGLWPSPKHHGICHKFALTARSIPLFSNPFSPEEGSWGGEGFADIRDCIAEKDSSQLEGSTSIPISDQSPWITHDPHGPLSSRRSGGSTSSWWQEEEAPCVRHAQKNPHFGFGGICLLLQAPSNLLLRLFVIQKDGTWSVFHQLVVSSVDNCH